LGIKYSAFQTDTSVSLFTTGQAATTTALIGTYEGASLSQAFSNPKNLDIIQVVNEGSEVVWNLTSAGVANTNPVVPTTQALLSRYEGSNFVDAFTNLADNDILQIIHPNSGAIVFGVTSQGYSYTTPALIF
jgi:hypothetical protein